jgi:transcriptional regulator of acetoin/glycerol metabolism
MDKSSTVVVADEDGALHRLVVAATHRDLETMVERGLFRGKTCFID